MLVSEREQISQKLSIAQRFLAVLVEVLNIYVQIFQVDCLVTVFEKLDQILGRYHSGIESVDSSENSIGLKLRLFSQKLSGDIDFLFLKTNLLEQLTKFLHRLLRNHPYSFTRFFFSLSPTCMSEKKDLCCDFDNCAHSTLSEFFLYIGKKKLLSISK